MSVSPAVDSDEVYDIQDEKILGTLHVATGRSDHLGGHLTPDKFKLANNATHDDILFSPTKTPETMHFINHYSAPIVEIAGNL